MHWWHWNEYRVAFTVKGDGFESASQLGVCVCVICVNSVEPWAVGVFLHGSNLLISTIGMIKVPLYSCAWLPH
jgi:hypothetical protein